MLTGCLRDAVIEYHNHLTNGKTPHIVWTNSHAYVITEDDFPEKIYCHNRNPDTTLELIQKILDTLPRKTELGEVKDSLYQTFKDIVL